MILLIYVHFYAYGSLQPQCTALLILKLLSKFWIHKIQVPLPCADMFRVEDT